MQILAVVKLVERKNRTWMRTWRQGPSKGHLRRTVVLKVRLPCTWTPPQQLVLLLLHQRRWPSHTAAEAAREEPRKVMSGNQFTVSDCHGYNGPSSRQSYRKIREEWSDQENHGTFTMALNEEDAPPLRGWEGSDPTAQSGPDPWATWCQSLHWCPRDEASKGPREPGDS